MDLLTTHSQDMRRFVEAVAQRAHVDRYEEASQLSQATIEVLGQAISGGEAAQLARWLPDELGSVLTEQSGNASRFDKFNFLDSIGARIPAVDTERVEQQVVAVLNVLRRTASGDELADTIAQLPPELSAMFGPHPDSGE
ncbi:DUF2267 domain-containing protein [Sciscionella marina]|uniref:DUF2267 domain-containing protein n=1 Tax=Sciscionella marina TaxID=508770 RepID=UPI0003806528|nr:DUF2267 domain-containing protein [Sciscionella marina]